jgi:acetyltransferase-like isoleucine patch superfamily enzyme
VISPPVTIDPSARIAGTAIVGAPFRPLLDGRELDDQGQTVVAADTWIGHYTIVGAGATIGAGSIIEEYVQIQAGAILGEHVLVTSRSYVGIGAKVAAGCLVRGHIGDNCVVGENCRIAGELIHRQLDPTIPWDDPSEEPSPAVGPGAFVGWRAVIVGGVNIGAGAYVCAGALITKDVPDHYIAFGRNEITHPADWPGALAKSPFFGTNRLPKPPVPRRGWRRRSQSAAR